MFHRWKEGKVTIISIYVDDLILLADVISEMKEVKRNLSVKFRMKDLGLLSYCLGIGITQGEGWLQIQQRQYLMNLLNRFELTDAHPVSTPADQSIQLVAEDGVSGPADQRLYQRMIGSLQYANFLIVRILVLPMFTISWFSLQYPSSFLSAFCSPVLLVAIRARSSAYKSTPTAIP